MLEGLPSRFLDLGGAKRCQSKCVGHGQVRLGTLPWQPQVLDLVDFFWSNAQALRTRPYCLPPTYSTPPCKRMVRCVRTRGDGTKRVGVTLPPIRHGGKAEVGIMGSPHQRGGELRVVLIGGTARRRRDSARRRKREREAE